jgi:hypothetical protein
MANRVATSKVPPGSDARPSVESVASLTRDELVQIWIKAYRRLPPKGISRRLLEHAAAYHLQAEVRGGLSAAAKRALARVPLDRSKKDTDAGEAGSRRSLPSGSRLIREWHGKVHTVDVTDAGYLYRGKPFRSLSEVARAITGVRWSGPRFFGT